MAGTSGPKNKESKGSRKSVEKLKDELKEKDKTIEEYISRLKYLQADFENSKKAIEREKESLVKCANDDLILKLLDVYENLERAVENGRAEKGPLSEGVEITCGQLKSVLENEGLVVIKAVGEKLDPFRHEAIMQEENKDIEEGTILEEFQRGYMLNDRVIRYSKVKVSKR
ncbi:MAG: nucleotide exchange factor GrpE [Candidatus Hydrothermarchaeaceae archaeon]